MGSGGGNGRAERENVHRMANKFYNKAVTFVRIIKISDFIVFQAI